MILAALFPITEDIFEDPAPIVRQKTSPTWRHHQRQHRAGQHNEVGPGHQADMPVHSRAAFGLSRAGATPRRLDDALRVRLGAESSLEEDERSNLRAHRLVHKWCGSK